MPSLATLETSSPVKMLLMGDPGTGKTGALASLAKAGYKLRILDFDNGLQILPKLLAGDSAAIARVEYETCIDDYIPMGDQMVPKSTKAATKAMKLLNEWKVTDASGQTTTLGKPSEWGRDTILVIDSLTHLSKAVFNNVLSMNGRLGKQAFQSDWGEAIRVVESIIQALYGNTIKCNVIILAHITYQGTEINDADIRGYPMSLGNKLPAMMGSYFNVVCQVQTKGSGANLRRTIQTVSSGKVDLKTSDPKKVPAELPQDTGLADLFKILLGNPTTESGK